MTTSIGFTPALACSTMKDPDGTLCGKPATAGTLYSMAGGNWILQPFCRDCTAALLRVYGPPGDLFPPAQATTPADDAGETARRAVIRRQVARLDDDTFEAIVNGLADMHEERNPGGFS